MAYMPPLTQQPTLTQLQAWVKEMKAHNDWAGNDFRTEAFLLMEEIGELCKAYRKTSAGFHLTEIQKQEEHDVGLELADVLFYIMSLAELAQIDITEAVHRKIAINSQRTWQRTIS
jgi:NTP pyrophosphatase (non-canonical NTP hydrolase)